MNHWIKQILVTGAVSLVVALISILTYHFLISPQRLAIREMEKARFVRENEVLLNGKMNHLFRSAAPDDFIGTAGKSVESVVFIRTSSRMDIKGVPMHPEIATASGSGVIVSSDGLIVTNNHVIDGADKIEVILNDNREFTAKLLGTDISTDLALLKIEAGNLPFLFFGNSDSLQVGEWVLAIGNPYRLQNTVTAGIVSAKARNINLLQAQGVEAYIQTDAAVNPGNSGGALVNTRGLLVGIIGAIMSESGKYEGFSFAIPSNLAQKVIYDIKEYGSVQRGWLGISIIPVDNQIAKEYELEKVAGVLVQGVNEKSAAKDAGIKSGDVILAVNGTDINANADFIELIARNRPGDKVELTYARNGKVANTTAILKNSMNTFDMVTIRKDKLITDLGIEMRELNDAERIETRKTGAFILSVRKGSSASKANIEPGYIVTKVNGKEIRSVDDFLRGVKESKKKIKLEGYYKGYPEMYPYELEKP